MVAVVASTLPIGQRMRKIGFGFGWGLGKDEKEGVEKKLGFLREETVRR